MNGIALIDKVDAASAAVNTAAGLWAGGPLVGVSTGAVALVWGVLAPPRRPPPPGPAPVLVSATVGGLTWAFLALVAGEPVGRYAAAGAAAGAARCLVTRSLAEASP